MKLDLFFTVKQTIVMIKALPDLFPSPVAPPKKLGHASEGMLHILEVRNLCMYDNYSFLCSTTWPQWIVLWLFFFWGVSVCRRPQHLSPGKTTTQPRRHCVWDQLHPGHWHNACVHLSKRGHPWQHDVHNGMLLHFSSHLPEMHSHTPLCAANRGLNGHHTWQRYDIVI